MKLVNKQKQMVSVDMMQMVIIVWVLAWHAMFDMYTLFHAALGAGLQTDSRLTELRLALNIIGVIAVLIRHPPFMPIAVGCLLQAAFHHFFTIIEDSVLLSKGGSILCTKQPQTELGGCLTTDVLRLMGIALWVIVLVLAAINVALRCKNAAPPSHSNNNPTNKESSARTRANNYCSVIALTHPLSLTSMSR